MEKHGCTFLYTYLLVDIFLLREIVLLYNVCTVQPPDAPFSTCLKNFKILQIHNLKVRW